MKSSPSTSFLPPSETVTDGVCAAPVYVFPGTETVAPEIEAAVTEKLFLVSPVKLP